MIHRFLTAGCTAAALSVAACTNVAAADSEARAVSEVDATWAQSLEDAQNKLFWLLGTPLGKQNFDMAAVIYVGAHTVDFMIRVDSYPERITKVGAQKIVIKPEADLWVIDRHIRLEPDDNEAIHGTIKQDQYYKGIKLAAFATIEDAMTHSPLLKSASVFPAKDCPDGNFYLVLLMKPHDVHRVYRQICDKDYATDISLAKPLFDIANAELPQTRDLVDLAWHEISTQHQN